MNKHYEETAFALVTGASEGIGRAIAEELASRKINLVLAALPGPELQHTACTLSKQFGIKTLIFETDLTEENSPKDLYHWCKKNHLKIFMLVNNAGIGHEGSFEETPSDFVDKMMKLNMKAVVELTQLFIPELKKRDKAYILNVGSLASFRPMPYKIIYTATKSFVFYFTRALREELSSSTVQVSVLCPGPVLTNDKVKARTNNKGYIGELMTMTSQEVASIAINKMLKGKPVIVPGMLNRFLLLFEKAIPRKNQMKILMKIFKAN